MALPELPDNREELLRQIREEREAFERVLAQIPEKMLLQPLLDGGWSVKDILSHIAAWEGMMRDWVEAALRGETPDRPVRGDDWVDALNVSLYEKNKAEALASVQLLFAASYERAYETAMRLTGAELFDPDYFAWRAGSPLAVLVAANTCWHYREHREQLERLVGAQIP
jgi:hypothetical protein